MSKRITILEHSPAQPAVSGFVETLPAHSDGLRVILVSDQKIYTSHDNAWLSDTPAEGWRCFDNNNQFNIIFQGGEWVEEIIVLDSMELPSQELPSQELPSIEFDPLEYPELVGPQGEPGVDGEDGITPHIGANGNWYIGDTDTGISATGSDGSDGADGEDGEDGITPHIGANGNWYIGDTDTGIPATGADGSDGADGEDGEDGITPHIGANGNWYIGDTDTGISATGGSSSSQGNIRNINVSDGNGGFNMTDLFIDGQDIYFSGSTTTRLSLDVDQILFQSDGPIRAVDENDNPYMASGDSDLATKKYLESKLPFPVVSLTNASTDLTAASHAQKYLSCNRSSAMTLNVSSGFAVGDEMIICQQGTGQVTVQSKTGAGQTINTSETLKTEKRYAVMALKCVAANSWILLGERELA